MANNEATYLSLQAVNALLPDNLKIDIENRLERSIYKTCEGKPLPVVNSKLYPQNYYWYSLPLLISRTSVRTLFVLP